jgi:hypothetical protein
MAATPEDAAAMLVRPSTWRRWCAVNDIGGGGGRRRASVGSSPRRSPPGGYSARVKGVDP